MRSVSNRRVPQHVKRQSFHLPKTKAKEGEDETGGPLDGKTLRELVALDKAGAYVSSGRIIERLLDKELDAAETAEYVRCVRFLCLLGVCRTP